MGKVSRAATVPTFALSAVPAYAVDVSIPAKRPAVSMWNPWQIRQRALIVEPN